MLPRKTSMAMPSSLSLTTNCSITSSSDWKVPGLNLRIVRSGDTLIWGVVVAEADRPPVSKQTEREARA